MSTNIDLFNQYTAEIFAELYEYFPVPRTMIGSRIAGFTNEDCNDSGVFPDEAYVASATLEWLWQAGYVSASGYSRYMLHSAVLSPKGLELMKLMPSSLESETSVGDKLLALSKSGAGEASKALVRVAMTELFKSFATQ
ncbi:hypothetical protein [Maridesulfovibrio sp.]|uniref:hypothetical protein n=1 Tax=Maridesulfovibrio sp. TaxID=2795000 RepID=UPI003BAA8848